jgi:hypothetical protein
LISPLCAVNRYDTPDAFKLSNNCTAAINTGQSECTSTEIAALHQYETDFLHDMMSTPTFQKAGNGGFIESCIEHVAAQGPRANVRRSSVLVVLDTKFVIVDVKCYPVDALGSLGSHVFVRLMSAYIHVIVILCAPPDGVKSALLPNITTRMASHR